QPCASAMETIQSASTPPPCPPMARMAIAMGFSNGTVITGTSSRKRYAASGAATLEKADDGAAKLGHDAIEPCWIVDNVSAVEGRAKHRRLGHFPAIAATDAGIVDRSHRVVAQRIVQML